jgi:hypothetical protein
MLDGYTLMKTHIFCFALALGLMICRVSTSIAQELSSSAPIVIQLSEIARYGVGVWAEATNTTGGVGLPYQNMKQSDVDALVRAGTLLKRSVWVMDGDVVIVKASLIGEFVSQPGPKAEAKYGLWLGFDSAEEAQKVAEKLRLEPSLDDLIRSRKSQLSDKRFWIP